MEKKVKNRITQGDWLVKHSESKDAWDIVSNTLGHKYKLARCPYLNRDNFKELDSLDKSEAKNNAILMSYSPYLYNALNAILGYYNYKSLDPKLDSIINSAKTLINRINNTIK